MYTYFNHIYSHHYSRPLAANACASCGCPCEKNRAAAYRRSFEDHFSDRPRRRIASHSCDGPGQQKDGSPTGRGPGRIAGGAAPPSPAPAIFGVSAWQCEAVCCHGAGWSSFVQDVFRPVSAATDRVVDSSRQQ